MEANKLKLMNDEQAARYLGVSKAFLAKGRCLGILGNNTAPPKHLKIGRAVRYRKEDLDAWINARTVQPARKQMTNDDADDGVYEAMAELDAMPAPMDVARAVTRLRAHGFSVEANVLLGRGDAAWAMLRTLRDALRRTDPAWCKLHRVDQIADEDLEDAISTLEDLLEDEP